MDLGEAFLQSRDEIQIILKGQIRMESADNVEFSDRFGIAGGRSLESFFQRHGICARSIFLASKSTETASSYANVGGIDVAVHVEVSNVAMHPLAHMVRQPANGQNIVGAISSDRILKVEPLPRKDLF